MDPSSRGRVDVLTGNLDLPYSGLLCEDFNLTNGLIRKIKISEVFITLHFVTHLHA